MKLSLLSTSVLEFAPTNVKVLVDKIIDRAGDCNNFIESLEIDEIVDKADYKRILIEGYYILIHKGKNIVFVYTV